MGYFKYKNIPGVFCVQPRYLVLSFIIVLSVFVYIMRTLTAEAEVAIFNSDTYVEQGVEITDETGVPEYIQYEHLWTDFKGIVPEESEVGQITIHLSWSSVIRSVSNEFVDSATVFASTTSEELVEEATTTTTGEINDDSLAGESETVDAAPLEIEEPIETEPELELESPEAPETSPESENGNDIPESVDGDVEMPIENETTDSIPEGNEGSSATQGFEEVSWNQLFLLANAEFDEVLVSEDVSTSSETGIPEVLSATSDNAAPDVLIAESIATTSGFVSSDIIALNENKKFFEVLYSIDGTIWHTLGQVGFDEAHETLFDISHIGFEMLPSLQISLRYTIPENDQTKIVVDALYLEVQYDSLYTEVVVEPIIPNDNEPYFEVSTIKSDVQSENIRAVVLERGGVLEFWYAVTSLFSDEVIWGRLAGGSSIDSNAPIAIKERTIFWLDRNQQTLFGYSVDAQSVFGVPFENPEEKVFQLPFQDDNAVLWEAIFDSDLNTLEFRKVRKESP